MTRSRLALVATAALLAVAVLAAPASAAFDVDFAAQLQGSHEVPPVATEANGRAVFDVIDPSSRGTMQYRLFVRKIDNVFAAHIHLGPPGENGPVVVTLFMGGPTGEVNGVLARGLITREQLQGPLEGRGLGALIREMQAGNTYVNVHTTEFPGGEIRGQVFEVSAIP